MVSSLDTWLLDGATLCVALEPCVLYLERSVKKTGAVVPHCSVPIDPRLLHEVEDLDGVLAEESAWNLKNSRAFAGNAKAHSAVRWGNCRVGCV